MDGTKLYICNINRNQNKNFMTERLKNVQMSITMITEKNSNLLMFNIFISK